MCYFCTSDSRYNDYSPKVSDSQHNQWLFLQNSESCLQISLSIALLIVPWHHYHDTDTYHIVVRCIVTVLTAEPHLQFLKRRVRIDCPNSTDWPALCVRRLWCRATVDSLARSPYGDPPTRSDTSTWDDIANRRRDTLALFNHSPVLSDKWKQGMRGGLYAGSRWCFNYR